MMLGLVMLAALGGMVEPDPDEIRRRRSRLPSDGPPRPRDPSPSSSRSSQSSSEFDVVADDPHHVYVDSPLQSSSTYAHDGDADPAETSSSSQSSRDGVSPNPAHASPSSQSPSPSRSTDQERVTAQLAGAGRPGQRQARAAWESVWGPKGPPTSPRDERLHLPRKKRPPPGVNRVVYCTFLRMGMDQEALFAISLQAMPWAERMTLVRRVLDGDETVDTKQADLVRRVAAKLPEPE